VTTWADAYTGRLDGLPGWAWVCLAAPGSVRQAPPARCRRVTDRAAAPAYAERDGARRAMATATAPAAAPPTPHRFAVADFNRMLEAGNFTADDRVEPLDGQVVDMSVTGPARAAAAGRRAVPPRPAGDPGGAARRRDERSGHRGAAGGARGLSGAAAGRPDRGGAALPGGRARPALPGGRARPALPGGRARRRLTAGPPGGSRTERSFRPRTRPRPVRLPAPGGPGSGAPPGSGPGGPAWSGRAPATPACRRARPGRPGSR
jgi:hypothetical protein